MRSIKKHNNNILPEKSQKSQQLTQDNDAIHHRIKNSMEAILVCNPALYSPEFEWLGWVANSCELAGALPHRPSSTYIPCHCGKHLSRVYIGHVEMYPWYTVRITTVGIKVMPFWQCAHSLFRGWLKHTESFFFCAFTVCHYSRNVQYLCKSQHQSSSNRFGSMFRSDCAAFIRMTNGRLTETGTLKVAPSF